MNQKIFVPCDKSIQTIGHLGIVAETYDSFGIAYDINRAIPITRHHHLIHSDVVTLMVKTIYDMSNDDSISYQLL
ncbi:MAG: DUF4277 domain-containing protein [Methanolinea sp.]|nr:DUF4277 domain-containing protein [Methanolinea sp.]